MYKGGRGGSDGVGAHPLSYTQVHPHNPMGTYIVTVRTLLHDALGIARPARLLAPATFHSATMPQAHTSLSGSVFHGNSVTSLCQSVNLSLTELD